MNIFEQLTAGDNASWTDDPFSDSNGKTYDALTYTLAYVLAGNIATPLVLTATPSGRSWLTAITTAQSKSLETGTPNVDGAYPYAFTAYVSKSGERVTCGAGRVLILPDIAGMSGAYDGRSQAATALDTVNAAIQARAVGDLVTKYMIGNRSLEKEPVSALFELRAHYRRVVKAERRKQQIANGLGNPRRVMVKFGG